MSLDLLNKIKKTRNELNGVTLVAPFSHYVITQLNKINFTLETEGTNEVGLHFWIVENNKAHFVRAATRKETVEFYKRHIIVPGIIAQDYIFNLSSKLKRERFQVDNLIELNRLEDLDVYDCAYSGNVLVPITRSRNVDRRLSDEFKTKLANRVEKFHVKHAHKMMYEAYSFLLKNTIPTLQERIQEALDFTGSQLISYLELPNNEIRITYRTNTGEYTSVFDINTLRVIRPGVCIYGDYDLTTLPAMIDYGVNSRSGDWDQGQAIRRMV